MSSEFYQQLLKEEKRLRAIIEPIIDVLKQIEGNNIAV